MIRIVLKDLLQSNIGQWEVADSQDRLRRLHNQALVDESSLWFEITDEFSTVVIIPYFVLSQSIIEISIL
jgi:hypothetical protein